MMTFKRYVNKIITFSEFSNEFQAFWCYTKAQLKAGDPIDLADMEQGFREQDMNTYLIAKVHTYLRNLFPIVSDLSRKLTCIRLLPLSI